MDATIENKMPPIGIVLGAREVPKGYERLADALWHALEQAAFGKGADRHATDAPFEQQPICNRGHKFGYTALLAQADKKITEVMRLSERTRKIAELRGAINYIAAAIIVLRDTKE